jgi:hypothetical protein
VITGDGSSMVQFAGDTLYVGYLMQQVGRQAEARDGQKKHKVVGLLCVDYSWQGVSVQGGLTPNKRGGEIRVPFKVGRPFHVALH